jgi:hypothetical protein
MSAPAPNKVQAARKIFRDFSLQDLAGRRLAGRGVPERPVGQNPSSIAFGAVGIHPLF